MAENDSDPIEEPDIAEELQALREQATARETGWQQRLEKIKAAVATMRTGLDEHAQIGHEREVELATLQAQVESHEKLVSTLRSSLEARAQEVTALSGTLDTRNRDLEAMRKSVADRDEILSDLQRETATQSGQTEALVKKVAELPVTDPKADAERIAKVVGDFHEWAVAAQGRSYHELAKLRSQVSQLAASQRNIAGALAGAQRRRWLEVGIIVAFILVAFTLSVASQRPPPPVRRTIVQPSLAKETPRPAPPKAPTEEPPPPAPEEEEEPAEEEEEEQVDPAAAALERKELRQALFDAAKAKDYPTATELGLDLRASHGLDWESALLLGDVLSRTNQHAEAATIFQEFISDFPDNKHVDRAALHAGENLVAAGKPDEARTLLEPVADKPGRLGKRAAQALAQLGR